jgi:hypothetical protein
MEKPIFTGIHGYSEIEAWRQAQALFLEVTAKNAEYCCSTLLLPHDGQTILPLVCSASVRTFEEVFLQELQLYSYWGIATLPQSML